MIIAGRSVGACKGYAYVRSEYPLALSRLREALEICRETGILEGFEITIVEGAGAFVCGEETALIAAIEGRRGSPRSRPPYPAERGLFGRPTLVHNVETLALLPWMVRNGADKFAELGTPGSPGTKTFALAGKINRGGLIEVPMGMTIRQVVERVGGGVQDERELKAVQIGGPSGSCIPASLCDCAVDFDALRAAGGMMGSGGFIVLDDRDCMVDVSRYFMEFTQSESCGKCTCCRIGTKRMLEILERLCNGEGRLEDIDFLEELARDVAVGSLCGLGKTAPNPVLSALTHFRSEFEAHAEGRCPAGRCRPLVTYVIGELCIGCTRCAQNCPVGAIDPAPYHRHSIDSSKCIRCGTCLQVCPQDAVYVESPRTP
jgi:NADH:ubiquinone oxidoreductase subunit F (NADH-binding)/NAD-dependent dihydropyrimidine dehydrogenase PreA subunit